MKIQTLFFSTLVVLIFTARHCSAMEKTESSTQFIPLDNGLLTEIEAKIAKTECGFWSGRVITDTTTTKKDTLINLIRYQKQLDNSKGAGPYELFCPIVLKELKKGGLINLGQFNPNQHKEAKEAIRQNKALYYNGNQGAIIYSLTQQPNNENLKSLIDQLQNEHKSDVKIPAKKHLDHV